MLKTISKLLILLILCLNSSAEDPVLKLNEEEVREVGDLQKRYQLLQAQLGDIVKRHNERADRMDAWFHSHFDKTDAG